MKPGVSVCSRSVVWGTSGQLSFLRAVIGCSHIHWSPAHGMGGAPSPSPALLCPHSLVGEANQPTADICWGMGGTCFNPPTGQ